MQSLNNLLCYACGFAGAFLHSLQQTAINAVCREGVTNWTLPRPISQVGWSAETTLSVCLSVDPDVHQVHKLMQISVALSTLQMVVTNSDIDPDLHRQLEISTCSEAWNGKDTCFKLT